MEVWYDLTEVEPGLGPTVVTVGNFDGVHRGHQSLLGQAREAATAPDGTPLPVVAITFHPHPLTVVRPDAAPRLLMTMSERLAMLESLGVDAVLMLEFTRRLAGMEATDFAEEIILGSLHAQSVVVGENFRFGHRAAGDVDLLRQVAGPRGVEVVGVSLDGSDDQVWSSTYVRSLIAAGDVAAAARALGRLHRVHGTVVRGDQRGRELGYPTANVPVTSPGPGASGGLAVPADGVYAGWLRRLDDDSGYLPAAISVGTNPTFDGIERRVESYVIDRTDLELYGVGVEVSFVEHLRGMVRFDSIDELVDQMRADVDAARGFLTEAPEP